MGRRMPSFIPLRLQSYDKICNQPNFFAFFLPLAPLFSEKELHTPAQACKNESALARPRVRTRRAESPHSRGRDSALARPRLRTRKITSKQQEVLWLKQSQRLTDIVKNNEGVWISTKLFYIVGSLSLLSIITIAIEIAFYVYFHWIQ